VGLRLGSIPYPTGVERTPIYTESRIPYERTVFNDQEAHGNNNNEGLAKQDDFASCYASSKPYEMAHCRKCACIVFL
jgi:hypothetical protein